ncbi:MAG: hypothetical protein IIT86_02875, partial [Oscillospiraceae bacterium]|nr:hypothetical protein [Oscillospiraceae bacterium]
MIAAGRIFHVFMHNDLNRQFGVIVQSDVMKQAKVNMQNIDLMLPDNMHQKSQLVGIWKSFVQKENLKAARFQPSNPRRLPCGVLVFREHKKQLRILFSHFYSQIHHGSNKVSARRCCIVGGNQNIHRRLS